MIGFASSDRALAAFVAQRAPDDRAELIERALRIGLHALQDAGTSIDVDFVRREFDSLLERNASANERAARELDQVLRTNFSDQDGRLPRTLERFLGDRGQLNKFVSELFDESKRDSAIGRMRQLLGTYFDGDASRLAQLLDPTRLGSPLHQFRNEMAQGFEKLNERLAALEAAQGARAAERSKSSAKGTDFEDLLEEMLGETSRAAPATWSSARALVSGDVIRSKKGDFLLTIDPQWCHGADLRVVIEAKNRRLSWREIREELDDAKRNRGAAMALAVFSPEHAPAGIEPFDVRYGHVFCVVDPAAAGRAPCSRPPFAWRASTPWRPCRSARTRLTRARPGHGVGHQDGAGRAAPVEGPADINPQHGHGGDSRPGSAARRNPRPRRRRGGAAAGGWQPPADLAPRWTWRGSKIARTRSTARVRHRIMTSTAHRCGQDPR